MNKESILRSATNIFGKIDKVGDDIYKGVWQIREKTAGIYYIDVSGKIAADFQQYQENVLAKEYYDNPGPLQWNYYLVLLQDDIDSELKKGLERDDRYARKIVLNESQFTDYFNLEKISEDEKINPVTEWKELLDAVDLQEIHGIDPVATVLTRFETNSTKKFKTVSDKRAKQDDFNRVSKISYLQLNDNYRDYPSIKEYIFGSVNLITGINGVGKTSLFEAIEMIICGRFLRGRKAKRNEKPGCIEASFNGSTTRIKFDPSTASNEKYRLRDQLWYANNRAREHELDISFSRYNFFSADAAFHFSNSDSREAVREALLNIVLGPEYDHIMQRMEKAYDRFKPLLNKAEANLADANTEKRKAENEIETFKKDSDLKLFRQTVIEGLQNLKLVNPPSNIDFSIVELEQNCNRLLVILDNVKKQELAVTFADMVVLQAEHNERKRLFDDFQVFLRDNNDKKTGLERDNEKLQVTKILLNDSLQYFSDERFFKLEGLAEKIRELQGEMAKLSRIRLLIESSEVYKTPVELSFTEQYNIILTSLELSKVEESNYKSRRTKYLQTAGEIEKVIQQIKTLGRQFLQINTGADGCPLCQTNFQPNELKSRIERMVQLPDLNNSLELKDVSDSLIEIETKIRNIEQEKLRLEQFRNAFGIAELSPDLNIKELLNKLLLQVKRGADIEKQIAELEEIAQYAKGLHLSESGLTFLKERLSVDKSLPHLQSGNKAHFEKALSDLQSRIDKTNVQISKLLEDRAKESFNFKKASGLSPDEEISLSQVQKKIEAVQSSLDSLRECFRQVKEIINIDDNKSILTLQLPLEILLNSTQTLRAEMNNQQSLKQAQTKFSEAETKIKKYSAEIKRFRPACETLKKILADKGGEQVNTFFEKNLAQIMDIFESIHSPREFVNISLRHDTLFLETEDGNEREITAISTGQRSALALSIFITLNRKLQNGPDIIMFDDPVSFIDDLNAVSFLDFLRYFILKENKQIFFATANKRLANLFEKKFAFLGNTEFKKWELKR